MQDAIGISHSGNTVEDSFRQLTGAIRAERAALGDAVLDGHYVEVKKASSTTLNQVRAVKYITLVAFSTQTETWYVVPASEIVRRCTLKERGQHTENPFESSTLSLKMLSDFEVKDPSSLRESVLAAVAEADRYPELRLLMESVLQSSKELSRSSRSAVELQLKIYGILASDVKSKNRS